MPPIPRQSTRVEGTNRSDGLYRPRSVVPIAFFGYGGDDLVLATRYNDYIDGGPGADYMRGNFGNDMYVVDNVDDRAVEISGQGTDSVYASVNYTLPSNVENLNLEGNAIIGIGNNERNRIFGNNLGNTLKSGGGAGDWISGGGGDDRIEGSNNNGNTYEFLRGDAGKDTIYGYRGRDLLYGGSERDKLYGGPDNDRLIGQSGNDILVGSNGGAAREIDTYTGGGGRDRFVLTANRGVRNVLAYDDFGPADYAKIQDFNLNEDHLQLLRGKSYGVANARRWGHSGAAITVDGNELIAVLENVSDFTTIDPSRHFRFIS